LLCREAVRRVAVFTAATRVADTRADLIDFGRSDDAVDHVVVGREGGVCDESEVRWSLRAVQQPFKERSRQYCVMPGARQVVGSPDDGAVRSEDEDIGDAAAALPSVVVGVLGVAVRWIFAGDEDAVHEAEDVADARFVRCDDVAVRSHLRC
jgi:hypothetical protein